MNRLHFIRYLEQGIHYDGRGLLEYRPIKVAVDVSNSAEGSAQVMIGQTQVLAGVKLAVETPYPDTPENGNLMVNAELLPISNPEFEPGPPPIQAIELARVVDRGIRESHAIDTAKLCIAAKEKVWSVMIDVMSINDEGNLFDASSMAALAAVKNARFPKYENDVIDYSEKTDKPLPLDKQPIAVTVHKLDKYFFVDPLTEEEHLVEARLTVAITEDGHLCAMQKGGEAPLSKEDIAQMVKIAMDVAPRLREKI